MRRAVWKFELGPLLNLIHVEPGAEVLYATAQYGAVVVYVLVDPTIDAREPRSILVVGTGHDEVEGNVRPLGVASLHSGALMFHVFEVLR